MNPKKAVIGSIIAVFGIVVIWVVVVAATVGSEVSKLDAMLKKAMSEKTPISEVQTKVTGRGFDLKPSGTGFAGRGPDYWATIYRTWITVEVTGDEAGTRGYHVDRAGSVF